MKNTILVLNVLMQKCLQSGQYSELKDDFEFILPEVKQFLQEEELLEFAGKVDGIIAGDDAFTETVLSAFLPRLKVISKWGVGLDSIDLDAAKRLGIPVFNSPGAFSQAVAEVAMGYMLVLSRHLLAVDQAVRNGEWIKPEGRGLHGQTLGIVGFGSIGKKVHEYARAFGMIVNAYDVNASAMEAPEGCTFNSLDDLCVTSDFICLCCNLTDQNFHLLDCDFFQKAIRKPFIVNVARGPVIDEKALVNALKARLIKGAALDVYEEEPLPKDSHLRKLKNVVLGSHNANNLRMANHYVNENTIKNLLSAFE